MYFVPQIGSSDCGISCLKMLLANIYHNPHYLHLPYDENHGEYSYKELSDIARNNGVSLSGFKVTDKNELKHITYLPAILRLKLESRYHAVLLYKINKKYVYIADPEKGKTKIKIDQFVSLWDGTGMFLSAKVDSNIYKYETFEPVSKVQKALALALQVISGIMIFISVFFMVPEGNILLPIIFLVASILFDFLLRLYLYKLMRQIDAYFESKYNDISPLRYYDFYVKTQNFKKNYLSDIFKLAYSILISVFIIIITIFNNLLLFPIIIIPILVASFDSLFFVKRENQMENTIAFQETLLTTSVNSKYIIEKVKKLQRDAYKYSKIVLLKRFIGIILFAITALMVEMITKNITLSGVVFALCIEVFLYQNLMPIFQYEENKSNQLIDMVRLSNIFYHTKYNSNISTK